MSTSLLDGAHGHGAPTRINVDRAVNVRERRKVPLCTYACIFNAFFAITMSCEVWWRRPMLDLDEVSCHIEVERFVFDVEIFVTVNLRVPEIAALEL